jgi:hypothetical protein
MSDPGLSQTAWPALYDALLEEEKGGPETKMPDRVLVVRDKRTGALDVIRGPWCPTAGVEWANYDRDDDS